MWRWNLTFSVVLLVVCKWCVWAQAPDRSTATDCDAKLEQARIYEMAEDPRAESQFRMVLALTGDQCPDAFLELSQNLSRNLRFRDALEPLKRYLRLVPADKRVYAAQDLRNLLSAAELKERVESSKQPRLDDLLKLTHTIEIYGRNHRHDAVSYAENTLKLYPDSVRAILSLVDLVLPEKQDKERIEALLNRAATLEPDNARIYATRGWLYLFSRDDYAERDFQRALLLSNHHNALSWKGLGYVRLRRGEKRAAIAAFRTYLKLTKAAGGSDGAIALLIEELHKS